jgi:hypothetical protein
MEKKRQPYKPNPTTMVTPEQGTRALKVMWTVMLVLMGVLYVIPMGRVADLGRYSEYALPSALAVAVLLVIIQIQVRRNLADDKLFPRLLDLGSWSLPEEKKKELKELRVPDRGVTLILTAHFIFNLIVWSLADGIAVLGRVVGAFTGDQSQVDTLFVVAAVSMLYFRPRSDALAEQVKRWRRSVEAGRG